MLTTDVLREVFQDIVGKHKAGVSFTLETNKVLDQNTNDLKYPCAYWVLPNEGLVPSAEILQDSFTINMLFLDQTGSDRRPIQRDGAHARMGAIAKQVFRRFHQEYIAQQGSWQGQPLDLLLEGTVLITPIYDDGTMQRTGVALTATLTSAGTVECEDIYFNA